MASASTNSPPSIAIPPPPPGISSATPTSALTTSPPPSSTTTTDPPPQSSPPPPVASLPPSTTTSPPAAAPPPPPPVISSPPPSASSPPPSASSVAPVASPPPPQAILPSPSPPPPAVVSPPPFSNTPPPPAVVSPPPSSNTPPPPAVVSPPLSSSTPPPPAVLSPPPSSNSPPPPTVVFPPPSSNSPPPPTASPPPSANPPANSPSPPSLISPPPPDSNQVPPSSPPPPSPTNQTEAPPPPSIPFYSSPPPPVAPPTNLSAGENPVILSPPSSSATPPISSGYTQTNLTPSSSGSPPTGQTPLTTPNKNASGNSTSSGSTSSGGGQTGTVVAIAVVLSFVILGIIVGAALLVRKRKKNATVFSGGYVMPSPYASSQQSDSSLKPHSLVESGSGSDLIYTPSDSSGLGNSTICFTYGELEEITKGFSPQNLLGEGGFGCVYKGCLTDGRVVAVKQLKVGGSQGEREFRAEVEIISRVHHRHLVSLVGYCIAEHERLLVYDYVPNNTLYYHLHEGRPVMDWATRVKVTAGAARGIAYLHEDCHPRIIHRDIKSSNILLDNNFEAQVADFGLAKLAIDTNTHVTTRVMGTFGYMAPEYASSGKLTDKSDVYSFGVMLLELITGRKPVDASQPIGDESLVEWARPLLNQALDSQDFEGLADPRLENNYVAHEMFRMIEAAAACVRHSASRRPRMGQVVRVLDCIGDSEDLSNGMRPGESKLFNSALESAQIRMFQRMAFGSQDYSLDLSSVNSTRSHEYGNSHEYGRSHGYGDSQEYGRSREYGL